MDIRPDIKDLINKTMTELRLILKRERADYWCLCVSTMKRGDLIQHIEVIRKMKLIKEDTPLDNTLVGGWLQRDIPIVPMVEDGLEMEIPTVPKLRKKTMPLRQI